MYSCFAPSLIRYHFWSSSYISVITIFNFFQYARHTRIIPILHQGPPLGLLERSSTMAMINQLHRGPRYHHQPTPYFFVGLPGEIPHSIANLTTDFRYLCGLHCIGLMPGPWMGPLTAAVAPMIELDLDRQLQQDVSTLPQSRIQYLS